RPGHVPTRGLRRGRAAVRLPARARVHGLRRVARVDPRADVSQSRVPPLRAVGDVPDQRPPHRDRRVRLGGDLGPPPRGPRVGGVILSPSPPVWAPGGGARPVPPPPPPPPPTPPGRGTTPTPPLLAPPPLPLPHAALLDPASPPGNRPAAHPLADIRAGQRFLRDVSAAFARSKHWRRGAFVVMYDEWGGFYDHVKPPILPDNRASPVDADNFGQ